VGCIFYRVGAYISTAAFTSSV